ncbi:hypothetical protein M758_11G035200 [Ceratodon purpureus]|nr:hypothetical protein M758_11G035200 [Ceratodon purpureus]
MAHMPRWCSFRIPVMVFMVFLFRVRPTSAGNKVRGIDPKDLAYFQGDSIWCKDGSKSFPRERLNDNFCDCPDGTDEPGTSACPASKYYCRNSGSAPKLVFASRVNDGICDCCDGSDEYEKRVNCVNTCGGSIKDLREELKEGFGQSTTFDRSDGFEDIQHHQQKKFGEDLVSRLKEMKAGMLVMQWLPFFSILFFLAWMSRARVSRRVRLRRKKSSRHSVV